MHDSLSLPYTDFPPSSSGEPTALTIFGTSRPAVDGALFGSVPESVVSNPRIAIVDDEPINIKVVKRYLTLAGYQQFFTTSNAAEAVELIGSVHPDVLLLDIMMPMVSGLDILRTLRQDERFSDLPVIILTAASDRTMKLTALSLGATEFLGKPIDSVELEARLKNVLAAKAHQDRIKNYAWELELEVAVRTTELVHAHLEVVAVLARAGEFRDNETGRHVVRVGKYAEIIARQLGMPPEFLDRIRHAAPLHDIGKIGIPDAILHKPANLNEEERARMQTHVALGYYMCSAASGGERDLASHTWTGAQIIAEATSPLLRMAASIALTHHERWDGTGYPRGLAGEAIPLEGRITAVADVFDAICSSRPYKPARSEEDAIALLERDRGTAFDPAVLDAFVRGLPEILEAKRQNADEAGTALAEHRPQEAPGDRAD